MSDDPGDQQATGNRDGRGAEEDPASRVPYADYLADWALGDAEREPGSSSVVNQEPPHATPDQGTLEAYQQSLESGNPLAPASPGNDCSPQHRNALPTPFILPPPSRRQSRTRGSLPIQSSRATTRGQPQTHSPKSSHKRAVSTDTMVMDEWGYYPRQGKAEKKLSPSPTVMDEWGYYPGERRAEKKARKPRKVLMDEYGYPTGETRTASSSEGDDAPPKRPKGLPRGRHARKKREEEEKNRSSSEGEIPKNGKGKLRGRAGKGKKGK